MIGARTPVASPVGPAALLARHGRRLARFGMVGASGVLVNTALLYALVEVAGLAPVLAAFLATEAAILSNFTLNDRWTFRDARPIAPWTHRAWRYNLVAGGGLLISVGVLAALTQGLGVHYLVANLVAIGAGFLWNYAGGSAFAWAGAAS